MNHMALKTPEERSAIARKSHATRRANRAKEEDRRRELLQNASIAELKLAELTSKLFGDIRELHDIDSLNETSRELTGKCLLRAEEIVSASSLWEPLIGVYFLIDGGDVVYVGQSVNLYSRIAEHAKTKRFDRYAFIKCSTGALDKLESLYIHLIRPRLNGDQNGGGKCAPFQLEALLGSSPDRKPVRWEAA